MRTRASAIPSRLSAAATRTLATVAMSAAKDMPYGSWPSPVTAKFITTSGVRLGALAVDGAGEAFWLEGRPKEKGRQAVVQYVGAGVEGASERERGESRTRVSRLGPLSPDPSAPP